VKAIIEGVRNKNILLGGTDAAGYLEEDKIW